MISPLASRLPSALLGLAILGAALFGSTAWAASPLGEWTVGDGSGRVRIVDCGGALWGIVTWESKPGIDDQNPDPAKRGRPILGMPVLLGLKARRPNEWWGRLYNSDDGKTYSGGVRLKSPGVLRVEGCVLGLFCGGEDWTRARAPDADPIPAGSPLCTRVAAEGKWRESP